MRVVDRRSAARVDTYALGLLGPAPASLIDEERAAAEAYLATMRDRCAARGLVATSEVRLGVPADEILAATHPADLLVLASHGRSGLTRWLLGSTAEAVVRQATGSVLLIRATAASPKD